MASNFHFLFVLKNTSTAKERSGLSAIEQYSKCGDNQEIMTIEQTFNLK